MVVKTNIYHFARQDSKHDCPKVLVNKCELFQTSFFRMRAGGLNFLGKRVFVNIISATKIIFVVNQWWLLDDFHYHHQYHHDRQQSDQLMQDCQHINCAWLRFGSVIRVSDIPSLHKFAQIFQSHHWTGQSNLVPLIIMAFEFMQCRQGWKGE